MTTARDLALITLGMPTDLPVAQGDLSLALAGIGRCSGGAPTGVVTLVSGVFTPTSWGKDGDGRTGIRRGHVAWGALGLRCLGGASQGARQLIDRRLLKTG